MHGEAKERAVVRVPGPARGLGPGRDAVGGATAGRVYTGGTAREVGAVDYTAIYQGVRRLETRSKKDDKLSKQIMRQYERKLASMYNV